MLRNTGLQSKSSSSSSSAFQGPVKRPGAEDPYNSVRQSEDNFGGEVYHMLKDAGYIEEKRLAWGAREVIVYELTPLGKSRYEWFKTINDELFVLNDGQASENNG